MVKRYEFPKDLSEAEEGLYEEPHGNRFFYLSRADEGWKIQYPQDEAPHNFGEGHTPIYGILRSPEKALSALERESDFILKMTGSDPIEKGANPST